MAPPPVAAAAPAPDLARIYASTDTNVAPPAVLRQELPAFTGAVFKPILGIIEVVIDESGRVLTANMRGPVSAVYDRQVLTAASQWRYKPALLDGAPVKYRKFIQISITPK